MRKFLPTTLLLICSLALTGQNARPLATLRLLVVNYFGTRLTRLDKVSLIDVTGTDWASRFDSSMTAKVPPGVYQLKIDASRTEMEPYSEEIVVLFPETSYVIGMEQDLPERAFGFATVPCRFDKSPPVMTVCYISGLYSPF